MSRTGPEKREVRDASQGPRLGCRERREPLTGSTKGGPRIKNMLLRWKGGKRYNSFKWSPRGKRGKEKYYSKRQQDGRGRESSCSARLGE